MRHVLAVIAFVLTMTHHTALYSQQLITMDAVQTDSSFDQIITHFQAIERMVKSVAFSVVLDEYFVEDLSHPERQSERLSGRTVQSAQIIYNCESESGTWEITWPTLSGDAAMRGYDVSLTAAIASYNKSRFSEQGDEVRYWMKSTKTLPDNWDDIPGEGFRANHSHATAWGSIDGYRRSVALTGVQCVPPCWSNIYIEFANEDTKTFSEFLLRCKSEGLKIQSSFDEATGDFVVFVFPTKGQDDHTVRIKGNALAGIVEGVQIVGGTKIYSHTIGSYAQTESGIHFPETIVMASNMTTTTPTARRVTFRNVSINKEYSIKELLPEFPDEIEVMDYIGEKYYLSGHTPSDDREAVRLFRRVNGIPPAPEESLQPSSGRTNLIILVNAIAALVIAGLVLVRSRAKWMATIGSSFSDRSNGGPMHGPPTIDQPR